MSDVGGDAACWLAQVCEQCGALMEDAGHRCPELEEDAMTTTAAPPRLLDDETIKAFRRDGSSSSPTS